MLASETNPQLTSDYMYLALVGLPDAKLHPDNALTNPVNHSHGAVCRGTNASNAPNSLYNTPLAKLECLLHR